MNFGDADRHTTNTFSSSIMRRANLDDSVLPIEDQVEEIMTTDEHGRPVKKMVRKMTTQRRVVRRMYIDENGQERFEEVEVPVDQSGPGLGDLTNGHTSDSPQQSAENPLYDATTSEEEYVRDEDGNLVKRVIHKVV